MHKPAYLIHTVHIIPPPDGILQRTQVTNPDSTIYVHFQALLSES